MSSNDYNRIANQIRSSLQCKKSFSLPLMTVADLGQVLIRLKAMEAEGEAA